MITWDPMIATLNFSVDFPRARRLLNRMVEEHDAAGTVFRALADPTRRAMVERLASGERTIGELSEPLDMTLAGASKHVGVLARAGIVSRRREGRECICSLNGEGLLVARQWVQRYARFWDERLDALQTVIEKESFNE
jgi:DNA-binding transcriptional ArsR family regulator